MEGLQRVGRGGGEEGGAQEVPCFEQLADIHFSDSDGEGEPMLDLKGSQAVNDFIMDLKGFQGGDRPGSQGGRVKGGQCSQPGTEDQANQLLSSELSHVS